MFVVAVAAESTAIFEDGATGWTDDGVWLIAEVVLATAVKGPGGFFLVGRAIVKGASGFVVSRYLRFVFDFLCDGVPFVDVMRGDVTLPGESKSEDDKEDEKAEEHPLTERIQAVIGEKVEGVRPSKRLTDSPACLVLSDFGMGIQMRKILEASGQSMPEAKPFFEFNAEHPLLHRLDTEQDEERFAELVELLFELVRLKLVRVRVF